MSGLPDDSVLSITPASIEALRARLHRINDIVQGHEGQILGIKERHDALKEQVMTLVNNGATREQVDHAITGVKTQFSAAHDENILRFSAVDTRMEQIQEMLSLKVSHIASTVDRIDKWVVGAGICIIGAVGYAVLQLVILKP